MKFVYNTATFLAACVIIAYAGAYAYIHRDTIMAYAQKCRCSQACDCVKCKCGPERKCNEKCSCMPACKDCKAK